MSLAQMLQQSGAIDSRAGELGVDPQTAAGGSGGSALGGILGSIVTGMINR